MTVADNYCTFIFRCFTSIKRITIQHFFVAWQLDLFSFLKGCKNIYFPEGPALPVLKKSGLLIPHFGRISRVHLK